MVLTWCDVGNILVLSCGLVGVMFAKFGIAVLMILV
jgi:hypothetical protein